MANNIKVVNNLGKGVEVHITSDNVVEINWESVKKRLSELAQGDIFKDPKGTEYIVCDQLDESTLVIRKDLLEENMSFGANNDWRESEVKDYLNNTYLHELKESFGEDAIRKIRTNLTSLDGYDDYGISSDMVGMMTATDYMNYHKYIGDCDRPYWLSTPNSTESGIGDSCVRVVDSDGGTVCGDPSRNRGVRPLFILQSDIFVSCDN